MCGGDEGGGGELIPAARRLGSPPSARPSQSGFRPSHVMPVARQPQRRQDDERSRGHEDEGDGAPFAQLGRCR
jgi:hypothetical protein